MFNSAPDPIAFTIFGIDVVWYGLLIATAFLVACTLIYIRAPKYQIEQDKTLDMFIGIILGGIIGARLYYVIFQWDNYKGDLGKILNITEGGLAIHGGLILGAVVLFFICKYHKINFLNCLDIFAPAVALGQAIGRWGNYFNSEAHGGPTDLPWAIPINGELVHPTFLYESIWCLLLFVGLILYENRRKFQGEIVLIYGALYSVERFFVEGLRTDSLMFGPFRQAQLFSLLIFIICVGLYIFFYRKTYAKKKS